MSGYRPTTPLWRDIDAEISTQRAAYREASIGGTELSNPERLAVLVEEVGEVAAEVLGGDALREELVQVAACAIAWIEHLERVTPS